jgi:hypothetical protein
MIIQTFVTKTGNTFQMTACTPIDAERNARLNAESYRECLPSNDAKMRPATKQIVHRAERLRANAKRRQLTKYTDAECTQVNPKWLAPHNNAPHKHDA